MMKKKKKQLLMLASSREGFPAHTALARLNVETIGIDT